MVALSKVGPSLQSEWTHVEVAGDRNNFFDLQKYFLEVKCIIVQLSEADLRFDAGAATDVTRTDAPYF